MIVQYGACANAALSFQAESNAGEAEGANEDFKALLLPWEREGSGAFDPQWVADWASLPEQLLFDTGSLEGTFESSESLAAAQQAITSSVYPFSTVVHILAYFPTGRVGYGSGVMVGRNDVLTAGHVLYNAENGGLAVRVDVVPFLDPANPTARPYGDAMGTAWVHPSYPQLGGGSRPMNGNNGPGYVGTELDVGFVTLNKALGDRTGYMTMRQEFTEGLLNQSGYPRLLGNTDLFKFTNDVAYARKSPVDNFIDLTAFETYVGNSGGPLWTWGTNGVPYVVGVVSSVTLPPNGQQSGRGLAAFDIDPAFFDYFQTVIASNDGAIIA